MQNPMVVAPNGFFKIQHIVLVSRKELESPKVGCENLQSTYDELIMLFGNVAASYDFQDELPSFSNFFQTYPIPMLSTGRPE